MKNLSVKQEKVQKNIKKKIVTRFAPSPTGNLHIGSVRTALFNWLYAKSLGGDFFLRIEDTDASRSKKEYLDSIIDGLLWLGINYKGIVFQSDNQARHVQVVEQMLSDGSAYRDKEGCVRIKFSREDSISFDDKVYGVIEVNNNQNEDFVLLRSNGTPTYMLAVVVDDYDMGVTHVIRGSDHITNTFKQIFIYQTLGWDIPEFCHIPLIHDQDGAKLSKRKLAIDVSSYKALGFIPEAIISYLVRLGWSCDSDDILPIERIIDIFNINGIGKSASRFDVNKFRNVNSHFMNHITLDDLCVHIKEYLKFYNFDSDSDKAKAKSLEWCFEIFDVDSHDDEVRMMIKNKEKFSIIEGLFKLYLPRVYTIEELLFSVAFFANEIEFHNNINTDNNDYKVRLKRWLDIDVISNLHLNFSNIALEEWNEDNITMQVDNTLSILLMADSDVGNIDKVNVKTTDKKIYTRKDIFMALRVLILGSESSPSIIKICSIVGKEFVLRRLIYI